MITEEYRELNAQLHASREDYGKSSSRWAAAVMNLCAEHDTQDILDYGCGKAELNLHMPFSIHCFDPAIPKFADLPEPADIVVCTDVMEHVEPEFTDLVLDNLLRLAKKTCLLNVATRPAVKMLADGRNAHLVVEPMEWWMDKIKQRFEVLEMQSNKDEFTCVLKPLDEVKEDV